MEKKNKKNKIIIISLMVIIILVITGIFTIFLINSNNNNTAHEQTADKIPTGENTVQPFNENEATNQEDISSNIFVTMSGYDDKEGIYVAANISGISEGDGVCYIHGIGPDGNEKVFSRQASWDHKTVQCGELNIAKNELRTGLWKVFIEYKSSKHIGKSNTMEVSVP